LVVFGKDCTPAEDLVVIFLALKVFVASRLFNDAVPPVAA
jgi:hypothetical protein